MSKNRIVESAGGILYRKAADPSEGEFEVCLVHRPKYDDWSWPKGKLELNESHRHAAVRELNEETGVPVKLGPFIGEVEYPLSQEGRKARNKADSHTDGPIKHVLFWMATPISTVQARHMAGAFGPVHRADKDEINEIRWLPIARARKLLTHSTDKEILALFVDRLEEGAAAAYPLLMVRHAKAEPRKLWKGTEAARPITPKGAAAAYALDRELACYAPELLLSSPWIRCQETMQMFSRQTGLPLESISELTEDAFAADPAAAWDAFRTQIDHMFATQRSTAICMHRPVIGGIFEQLRPLCASPSLAQRLISKTPFMPTGHALALFIVNTPNGPRIIDIQKVAPIVY